MWMPRGPGSQPRRLRNARGDRRPTFAFRAQPRVRAALSPGGAGGGWQGQRRPEGPPENYYAAFVIDPDGHNVEAVCLRPE